MQNTDFLCLLTRHELRTAYRALMPEPLCLASLAEPAPQPDAVIRVGVRCPSSRLWGLEVDAEEGGWDPDGCTRALWGERYPSLETKRKG